MALGLALERRGSLTQAFWPFLKWCATVMERHLAADERERSAQGRSAQGLILPALRQVLRGRRWRVTLRLLPRESALFQRMSGVLPPHVMAGLTRSHPFPGGRARLISIVLDVRTIAEPTRLAETFIHELAHATHRVTLSTFFAREEETGRGRAYFRRDLEERQAEVAEEEFRRAVLREGVRLRDLAGPGVDILNYDPLLLLYQMYCETVARSRLGRTAVAAVCASLGRELPCSPARIAALHAERALLYRRFGLRGLGAPPPREGATRHYLSLGIAFRVRRIGRDHYEVHVIFPPLPSPAGPLGPLRSPFTLRIAGHSHRDAFRRALVQLRRTGMLGPHRLGSLG